MRFVLKVEEGLCRFSSGIWPHEKAERERESLDVEECFVLKNVRVLGLEQASLKWMTVSAEEVSP